MARKAKDQLAQQSFETLMQRLEAVVGRLEGKGLTLEESLAAFEEGISLVRESESRLNDAEKKVEQLLAAPDGKLEVADLALTLSDDGAQEASSEASSAETDGLR